MRRIVECQPADEDRNRKPDARQDSNCCHLQPAHSTRKPGNACFDREHLVLQLGDQRVELAPFDGSARDAGISQPIHRPSLDSAEPAVYTIDLATLGLVAKSTHPVLYCGAEKTPLKYELWEDRLPALRELVRQLHD